MSHLASLLGARGVLMSLFLTMIVVVGVYVGKGESGNSTDPSTVVVVNVDHGGGSTPRSRLSSSMSVLLPKGG